MPLGLLFAQADWMAVFISCFAVALITLAPEFYAMAKSPTRWIPINSPPFMIGDDYHYFSLLNSVHRRFVNWVHGSELTVSPLSANSKFQLFGYLFNLIPYHLGYLVSDRRLGVVLVRLWNRFLLGFVVSIFAIQFYGLVNVVPTTEIVLLTYLVFFLLFPGPFGLGVLASIARQIGNRKCIYERGHANDLTRAMFSETTGPLLLIGCTLLLMQGSEESRSVIYYCQLLLICILFFHYLPAALVYSFLMFIVLMNAQFFYLSISCAVLTLGLAYLYIYSVSRDEIGAELFAHSDGGRIFAFSRYHVLNAFLVVFCAVVVCILISEIARTEIILVFLGSGFFVFTNFFAKHQASRFWDRAAIIPFQLIATVSTIAIAHPLLGGDIPFLLVCALLIILLYYYCSQSVFLYQTQATVLPGGVEFKRDICARDFESSPNRSRIVATNSIVCACSIDMFSDDESLLRNYSIQPHGYRKHLVVICANFKILGMDYKSFESLLTSTVSYGDWLLSRPFKQGCEIAERCYAHTLQFIATNREFNAALVTGGMYVNGVWTDQYKALLRTTWDSIDSSKFKNVHRFVVDTPF